MKKILFLSILSLVINKIIAQDFGQILAGSLDDANKYAYNYMLPFGEGEIYNLARGWVSTGRTHKLFGFDISVNGQFAYVPVEKQSFIFNNSDYKTFSLAGTATSAVLPTFMGANTTQVINVNNTFLGTGYTNSFTAPSGIGDEIKGILTFVPISDPMPILQVGVGILKHTDLKIRYFPKSNYGGVEIAVAGAAIQHEFGWLKKIPFLHLSALAGYSTINAGYPPKFNANSSVQSSDANATFDISSFTLQGIASVKFSILELYTSVGYISGKSTVDFLGTYRVKYNNQITVPLKDPISLTYTGSGISNTWGARLNLSILKIYADYTFSKYNGVGFGLAFAFR